MCEELVERAMQIDCAASLNASTFCLSRASLVLACSMLSCAVSRKITRTHLNGCSSESSHTAQMASTCIPSLQILVCKRELLFIIGLVVVEEQVEKLAAEQRATRLVSARQAETQKRMWGRLRGRSMEINNIHSLHQYFLCLGVALSGSVALALLPVFPDE